MSHQDAHAGSSSASGTPVRAHLDNGPLELLLRLLDAVEVAVDVAAVLRLLCQLRVVAAREEAHVVDEGDARREELDGAREEVPEVVVGERAVVGAVDLQRRGAGRSAHVSGGQRTSEPLRSGGRG